MLRRSHLERVVLLGSVLFCCLVLAGCKKDGKDKDNDGGDKEKSKVSQANFDKVETGMSEKDVEGILGPPDKSAEIDADKLPGGIKLPGGGPGMPDMPKIKMGKFTDKEWTDDERVYHVTFQDGKVMGKVSQKKE